MPHLHNHANHPVAKHLVSEMGAYARKLAQHEDLERELAEETRRPMVDWDRVKLLKIRKLRIVEELERLSHG